MAPVVQQRRNLSTLNYQPGLQTVPERKDEDFKNLKANQPKAESLNLLRRIRPNADLKDELSGNPIMMTQLNRTNTSGSSRLKTINTTRPLTATAKPSSSLGIANIRRSMDYRVTDFPEANIPKKSLETQSNVEKVNQSTLVPKKDLEVSFSVSEV